MKLHIPEIRRSRLDGLLFIVLLLWLVTSMLLVLLYHPGAAHALQPHQPPAHELVAHDVPQPPGSIRAIQ